MMPNFFVIGAQKAGTTSLYHYLAQHPQVYMSPVKEPCFFNYEIDPAGRVVQSGFGNPDQKGCRFSDVSGYRELFRGANSATVIGEASPPYIYVPGTAERIEKYAPGSKVVAILRNPADRAYSAYLHAVRIGKEPLGDFSRALLEEEERVRSNWHYTYHYRSRGYYYDQLARYFKVFGRDRVGVWLYEDLRSNPVGVAQDIFGFLNVDDAFAPDTNSKHNPSGVPKGRIARVAIRTMDNTAAAFLETFTSASRIYPFLSRMRQRVQRQMVAKPPPLDPKLRVDLTRGYREDILKLQELIGRDLSAWLEVSGQDRIPELSKGAR